MCGITGAIWTDPKQGIDAATLQKMTDVIRHRGPDDEGHYHSEFQLRPPYEAMPEVALGFRRLSIIDLEGGRQPMSNEDGSVWVVFNGEIYNYQTIRRRLEGAGHTFRTQCDTETIVHLYEDEGLDFVQHLNGMFAVAIWDSRARRLVLARDRIGQKPLVYHTDRDRLLFASELKSLLQVEGVSREIDPGAIDEYLTYQYIPYPKTIFRGIKKLPPGHLAVFQDGKLDVQPYWQPNFNTEISISPSAACEKLTELLSSSVEMRMRSDVPLGAFLSGGIDSSLIVALMQQRSEQPIKTFTIGFPVAEYDETSYARQVSEHLGTEHEELEVTPSGVEILPKLVWQYDEPFADSSSIPTWYVSEMTRRKVTVAISGDGSDELFAGYPRYRAVWLASLLDETGPISSFLGAPVWQRLPGSRQKSFLRRFKRFSEFLSKTPQRRYLEWIAIFNESRRAMLYRDEFVEQLPNTDPFSFLSNGWARSGQRDVVSGASLADVTTYLTCDLMTKVDIASMAHSLEVRQPFLDHRVVEFAASLPVSLKFRRGAGKQLLRRTFGDLLPADIWNRKKMGFGVPLDHWFRDELRELTHDVLLDESARSRNYFRGDAIEELVQQHESRQFDHAYRLWALLVLELWMREWC
ncbi:MAG: asparagine synthase (glutamine-hydrolyzing) [Planctomycetaceae bacterium]|nr:asparagine synthase (glutamine-hydrolyzing) [Planctomycetaceae bacterium]